MEELAEHEIEQRFDEVREYVDFIKFAPTAILLDLANEEMSYAETITLWNELGFRRGTPKSYRYPYPDSIFRDESINYAMETLSERIFNFWDWEDEI